MIIVNLSGGSGSGKTTLSKQVASKFPEGFISILPMDAYYKNHSHLNKEEQNNCNFDHPDSMDFDLLVDHIQKLRKNLPVERPIYSYCTCSRQLQSVQVYPTEIILLEGHMALIDERVRHESDVKVFIDTDELNRLERIIKRDMKERGRSLDAIMERFYKTVQPMHEIFVEPFKHFADVTLDGNISEITLIATSLIEAIDRQLHTSNYTQIR